MLIVGGSGVGVGVGVAVGVEMGDGEGVGVGIAGLKTGFRVGCGAALIVTPLLHTSFVPDLMHVYFLPDAVEVDPTLAHLAPALGVAACTGDARASNKRLAMSV
jgi:hypothetical protein